ncbi:MAG: hypothetical protein IJH41_07305 [Eubacterium sp.]|nr:hypothetical protein [Eubacterium sp.]
MNKKLKKILVVLLSALMVLTYMPATALTAFAAIGDEKTVEVVSPETIPDQEWTGEDLDLSTVEELATIKADVFDGEAYSYGVELTRDVDYTVKSSTNQAWEGAYVVFTGINDYEGYEFYGGPYFDIVETPEEPTYDATIDSSKVVYDGPKTKAEAEEYVENNLEVMIIKNGLRKLLPPGLFHESGEYKVEAKADSATATGLAGETYTVTVTVLAHGRFFTEDKVIKEETVTIAKRDLSTVTLVGTPAAAYEYNGDEQKATFTKVEVDHDPVYEVPAADYEITGYEDNVKVTTQIRKAKAIITAKESSKNFTGEGKVKFEISKFNLGEGSTVRIMAIDPADIQTHEYDGEEFKPEVSVRAYFTNEPEAKKISEDDYDILYEDPSVDAKAYKVGIQAKDDNPNLDGATVADKWVDAYVITPADLAKAGNFIYVQKKDVPAGTEFDDLGDVLEYFDVTVNGIVVTEETEGISAVATTADAEPNKDCEIQLNGTGNFKNSNKIKYQTVVRPFAPVYTSRFYNPTYTGEAFKPFQSDLVETWIVPEEEGYAILGPDDFEITGYENNTHAGTATVNIQGKNNYLGQTSKIEFEIDPIVVNDDDWSGWTTGQWQNTSQWDQNNQRQTRTRTKTAWTVASVTGIKNGTYCIGSIIEGAKVSLQKVVITETETRTRRRNNQWSQWTTSDWSAPSEETEPSGDPIALDETDFVLTASGFTTSETSETQGKLTEVTVTLTDAPEGNYKRDADQAALTFDTTALDIDAKKVNLNNAVVTGTIPATLSEAGDVNETTIQENITVTVDGVELSAGAYTVSAITPDKAVLNGKVSFRVNPAGSDEQVIGHKDATVDVEAVDISQFADAFAAVYVPEPADDPFVYNGEEHKPVVPSVTISEDDEKYPYAEEVANEDDYTLSYSDNINAGTATVTFTGKGKFKGTATATFQIRKAALYDLTPSFYDYLEDPAGYIEGSSIYLDGVKEVEYKQGLVDDLKDQLSLKVKKGEKYVIDSSDYEIVFLNWRNLHYTEDDDHNPTTYVWYVVRAKEDSTNYTAGTIIPAYPVVRKQLNRNNVEITLKQTVFTVDEADDIIELADPTVMFGETELFPGEDEDYTVDVKGTPYLVEGEEGYVKPYLEFGFVGDYAGVVKMPIGITIDDTLDFEGMTLTVPPESRLVYNGYPKYVMPHYIGTGRRPHYGSYTIVYKTIDGEELAGAPVNVGTYTATIKAAEAYGGQTYASKTFQIKQRKLSDTEFEELADELFLGDVEYQAAFTKDPVIYNDWYWDDDEEIYIEDTEFEVVRADKEWDGKALSGKATVKLKDDSNYRYADSEVELEFFWEKGSLSGEPADYYEIPDQEYTGEKLEPTTILTKEGWDLDPSWVEIKYYEGNDQIAGKTAKAFVKVTVPEDAKYYDWSFEGYITFGIIDHQITPEEAREDAEEAEHAAALVREDPDMPDSQKAKVAAAADALAAVLENPLATPEEIEAAVDDLYDAIYEAEAYKDALADAVAETIAAGLMIMTGDYTDDTVTALTAAIEVLDNVIADPSSTSDDVEDATAFLAAIIEKAQLKALTTVSLADTTVTYNGKAPEMPTPTILGSTGAVTYKYYSDAEGTTEIEAPVNAGKYYAKACVAADAEYRSAESHIAKLTINKAKGKIKSIKPTKKTVKAGKSFKLKAKKTGGKVTFKKSKGDKKITVSKKGKVKVNKKLKAGTYKITVKATAKATKNYKKATKKAVITIKVK